VLEVMVVVELEQKKKQECLRVPELMAWIKDSKVRESGTTPYVMHKAMISAGNLSLEELDWAICEI